MDSGAYTAWRSGKPIDLEAYCRFLKANEYWVGCYAALDVINPGHPEDAAAASMENYKIMRKHGLRPIPIFHVGEDVRWLKEMLDLGADYIGLSASSLVSRNKVDSWYDLMWEHLCDSEGRPLVKAHAFGEGREATLKRGPWYSADSASWIYSAQRTASITIGGKKLSHRHDKASSRSAQDIDALAGEDRATWEELIARYKIGEAAFTRDKVGHFIRTYLLAKHYIEIETRVRAECPIRFRSQGMHIKPWASKRKPVHIPAFNLHLVIGTNAAAAVAAVHAGATNVLISYAHLPEVRGGQNLPALPKFDLFATEPHKALSESPYERYDALIREHVHA